MGKKVCTFSMGFLFLMISICQGVAQTHPFNTLSVLPNLPNKDVQSIYQDRDGYIWISTRKGLFQYDGYSVVSYKSNLYKQDLLTNNYIYCTVEDANHCLWIGTYNGVNILNKRTGIIRKLDNAELEGNGVSAILITRDNRVWLGTERGLYEYLAEQDSCLLYDTNNTNNVLPKVTVKTLFEDDKGDIWIGTWGNGLFRYEHSSGKFLRYPQMNPANSAYTIYQDSHKNIWVGTWKFGLQLLHNAYDLSQINWTTFEYDKDRANSLSDNLVHTITEDTNNNSLWIGTRSGISVLSLGEDLTSTVAFDNYYAGERDYSISGSEVASLMRDRQGILWVGMLGGGVNIVNTHKPNFELDTLWEMRRQLRTSSVYSMLVDDEGLLWLGVGMNGFGIKNRESGKFTYFTQMPEFASFKDAASVMSIMQSSANRHIWMSIYDRGVFEYDKSAPVGRRVKFYNENNAAWLNSSCVLHIYEDTKQNLWFSTRHGVSVRMADGTPLLFDSLQTGGVRVKDIVVQQAVEDNKGDMWFASKMNGVLRIQGHGPNLNKYKLSIYSAANGKLSGNDVECVHKDMNGRIWAGTGSNGLNLYDEENDTFKPVQAMWKLPGDAINSIQSDLNNNLWLGTDMGLIKLYVPVDLKNVVFHLYTTADGLQDNIFNRGAFAATADGELLFGGCNGYNSFFPASQTTPAFFSLPVITDIKVFNQSWEALDNEERAGISLLSPGFTDRIRLDYQQNNFTIEFSALEYANPERNQYAYKLEGFDGDWRYTDASKRFAYYNNLNAGTYTFCLRVSNSNGIWDDNMLKMEVVILPPPWKTWWAYAIYVLLIMAISYYSYRLIRNRIRLRNALHLREIEKVKAEEVNHAKLQFFTNITHELLTPLTVLSASVDELRRVAPTYKEQYRVMANNINRLIRLLQQILEFRKSETGNLKLRVSRGDLAQFVRCSLDSFCPLMKKKDIKFSLFCHPEPLDAYFDPDKLDKVLYNLLSNASKYNSPGGTVSVELTGLENGFVRLVVRDDGPGISQEAQKDLFKRFYEGDYRKFKAIGTGIGLSLVRDLVILHHGTVTVESEIGNGTAFIVMIPIQQSSYAAEEIESDLSIEPAKPKLNPTGNSAGVELSSGQLLQDSEEGLEEEPATSERTHALLIVEDDEDLLHLMVKLLETDYFVYTATNGHEAIKIMEQEDVNLIVSDVMMPEMDGIELCRYIKNNIETSHIPIILLTAKNKEEDRVEAYESGADGFISKPFSLSILHARIANLLRSRQRVVKDFKKQLVFEAKDLNYTSLDEDFLQRAIDCVNHHLDDPDFDLVQFIEEMHTTKSTSFRKLKSLTGQSFPVFVRNIRMKAACRIMEEKKHVRISELAYAVGYNDPSYFSISFKKEIGMIPSEYMERFTSGGAVEGE